MAEPVVEQVLRKLNEVADLYHRLVLVVGSAGAGKTAALREVHERTGAPFLNINLELSTRLLDVVEKQRPLRIQRVLDDIIGELGAQVVLLDNIEMLFDASLKQDPLRLLQAMSRNRTIVAAWNGTVGRGRLTYAVPGHPEYRHYPTDELVIVVTKGA